MFRLLSPSTSASVTLYLNFSGIQGLPLHGKKSQGHLCAQGLDQDPGPDHGRDLRPGPDLGPEVVEG